MTILVIISTSFQCHAASFKKQKLEFADYGDYDDSFFEKVGGFFDDALGVLVGIWFSICEIFISN